MDDQVPYGIDGYILKEGALIDAWRHLATLAAEKGQIDTAAFYRNESRAQNTSWGKSILEAVAADRNTDDATFILSSVYGSSNRGGDIKDARDEIFARGSRP